MKKNTFIRSKDVYVYEEPLFQNRDSSKVNLEWKVNGNHTDDRLVWDSQSVISENDTYYNEDQKEMGSLCRTSR